MARVRWIPLILLCSACAGASSPPEAQTKVASAIATPEQTAPDSSDQQSDAEPSPPPSLVELKLSPALTEGMHLNQFDIAAAYKRNLSVASSDLGSLMSSLDQEAKPHRPAFAVDKARHFALVNSALSLPPEAKKKFLSQGFVSLETSNSKSMGSLYLDVWQADLPVLITTDSILHAWHRSYDSALMAYEEGSFADAYRTLLTSLRAELKSAWPTLPSALKSSAQDLDLYLAVGASLLGKKLSEKEKWKIRSGRLKVDHFVPTLFSGKKGVQTTLKAIEESKAKKFWLYGSTRNVDFSQFKARGHYTKSPELQRYFRALMWMGRADTGLTVVDEKGRLSLRGAKTTLLMALLAKRSESLPDFERSQGAIDYFVGSSNGLSLGQVVKVLNDEGVALPSDLSQAKNVERLAALLAAKGPRDRVTSQALWTQGKATPPPLVFQLSGQRFTLDSFVHDRTSFDDVADRMMVSGLDVFASFGNDEAVRLLRPELEEYQYAGEISALRQTISEVSPEYWEQSLYTRWFDALRTLNEVPGSQHLPSLFVGRGWQRKQLQNQLASWAELRRDTILYVAQPYASISCDFPDVYVEPYPRFFDKMEHMAMDASKHLGNSTFFDGFAKTMARLEQSARAQLTGKTPSSEDTEFLKNLVKVHRTFGCGGPGKEWSGWYRDLFWDKEVDLFEPVIADVFTDPNSGLVLNAATTAPELALIAIETPKGPTVFVGPISGYREFKGHRMSDDEWKKKVLRRQLPGPLTWTNDFRAGRASSPRPHPVRKN